MLTKGTACDITARNKAGNNIDKWCFVTFLFVSTCQQWESSSDPSDTTQALLVVGNNFKDTDGKYFYELLFVSIILDMLPKR